MPHNLTTRDDANLYNAKIKIFPHQIKTICFSQSIFNPDGAPKEQKKRLTKEEREERQALWLEQVRQAGNEQYLSACEDVQRLRNLENEKKRVRADNVKRARDKAYEIAHANEWEYFVTMTLNQNCIDRYDKVEILRRVSVLLNHETQRRNLKYLIFPEYHTKDDAVHFHGLCSGNLDLAFSGHYTSKGQSIYNWLNWTLGFTTVVKLEGPKERIINYVMKYITKQDRRVFGKSYLSGGKGLIREVPTQYENISFLDFEGKEYQVPETGMRVKYQTIERKSEHGNMGRANRRNAYRIARDVAYLGASRSRKARHSV